MGAPNVRGVIGIVNEEQFVCLNACTPPKMLDVLGCGIPKTLNGIQSSREVSAGGCAAQLPRKSQKYVAFRAKT